MKKHEFPFSYKKIRDEDLILWYFYIDHNLLLFKLIRCLTELNTYIIPEIFLNYINF